MQLLKVISVTLVSPLGELPCNGVSYRPIYTFLLTGYATESNEKIYLLFYASDSRY